MKKLLLLIVVLFLCACSKQDSLVGTWIEKIDGDPAYVEVTYKMDGSFHTILYLPDGTEKNGFGTWKSVNNNEVCFTKEDDNVFTCFDYSLISSDEWQYYLPIDSVKNLIVSCKRISPK